MARLFAVTALALALIGAPTTTGEAGTNKRAICEMYCLPVTAGCYVFLGIFVGRKPCEEMYKGCVNGCVAAIVEAEEEAG